MAAAWESSGRDMPPMETRLILQRKARLEPFVSPPQKVHFGAEFL
jgi:hypothetical protein